MMPTLTLTPRDSCALCGSRLRGFMIGSYRINKGSLRAAKGSLSWTECPECGPSHVRRNPLGVTPYCQTWRPDAESQAVVDAVHVRKGWTPQAADTARARAARDTIEEDA